MRFVSGSLIFLSSLALLSGCSDKNDSSSSTASKIEGWVGAQGLNNAQVVINQVAESGQISVDSNGIYLGLRESTDTRSRFTGSVASDEVLMFIARGQIANVDKDKNNLATLMQCQLAAGCTVQGTSYGFADFYSASVGFEWRSVAYTVSNGSRNNVNAITTLAAAFAYQFDVKYGYDNHASHNHTGFEVVAGDSFENEIFTPYDVVLGNSQTANVLGLQDVIGDLPANLTQLNNFNENTAATRNQIRYGALLAGLQQLELNHTAATDFVALVAEQFAKNNGQFYQHSGEVGQNLTLQDLYKAAHDNLASIAVNVANAEAKAAANAVVAALAEQLVAIEASAANSKTTAVADELSQLLTAGEVQAFNLGLEKTKLFVKDLLNYQQTFWQPGYKSELDGYLTLLKTLGDEHRENLDDLAIEFARIQTYYVDCKILKPAAIACAEAYTSGNKDGLKDITDRVQSYNEATKVLTFAGGASTNGTLTSGLVVSQKIADINSLDSDVNPTRSQAIDVFITGDLERNNLVLTLAHSLDADGETIKIPSAMRVYYNQEVSELPSVASADFEVQGYELIWGEFQLYDKTNLGTETELSGAFRIFYRGLRDPQDTSSELRFNIENWVLSATISDKVDDVAGADRESTSLVISGNASNPDSFYPAQKLAKFDGFFSANNANPIDAEIADLLSYSIGEENVVSGSKTITVKIIDFINTRNDDIRYRFYPSERVVDENDSDRDGNITEVLDMHRIEECKLNDSGKVKSCGPKTKVFAKVDMQKTINDLWKLGLFQRIPVDGHGTYFVNLPATKNDQGCYELNPLDNNNGIKMKGTLIEQQVLGLDSIRLLTEIKIEDANLLDLPKTLLDINVVAPTQDKYRITAGLSHNYSSTTSDNSGIILGTGGSVSSLLVSYDTSGDFENVGNLSIAKAGVTLSLADGTAISENQDITAFSSQRYDPASVNYKIIEDAEGQPVRCVISVGSNYVKDPADAQEVLYLNYRDVIYATIRPEGDNGIWTIRYLDGSWMVPSSVAADVKSGS
jgi:hypothetical protein